MDVADEAAAEGGAMVFTAKAVKRYTVYGVRFFLFWPAGDGFAEGLAVVSYQFADENFQLWLGS